MGISQHYPVIDPHLPPQFGHLPSQINLGANAHFLCLYFGVFAGGIA